MRTRARLVLPSIALAFACACAPPPDLGPDTSLDAGGDDEGEDDDAAVGADVPGVALDAARLDRSADVGRCGFPGPAEDGYGSEVGQRFSASADLVLIDCDGEAMPLSDFFCERAAGGHNAGILVNIGAGWCGPCQDETLDFPEIYEDFHDRGIELVQVLFQDWTAQAPTETFCSDWSEGRWRSGSGTEDIGVRLAFPVLLDQANDWTSTYLSDPATATPVNLLVDANGNIRWKSQGQRPDPTLLRAQLELVVADPYGE